MIEREKCPRCGGKLRWIGGNFACPDCRHIVYPPQNLNTADKLRRMTDRDLANTLAEMSDKCANCQADTLETCRECWFWQLQQPAEKGKAMPEIKVRCEACGHLTRIPTVTNADRIRAMSDAELAEWAVGMLADCDNNDYPCGKYCPILHVGASTCLEAFDMWLKSPAEKDGAT